MTLAVGGWIALTNLAMWTILAHRAVGAWRARQHEQRHWS